MIAPLTSAGGGQLAEDYCRWVAARGIEPREFVDRVAASPVLALDKDRLLPGPAFLAADERQALARDLATTHTMLTELPERLFDGSRSRLGAAVGMNDVQLAVLDRAPRGPLTPFSRSDLYRGADGFRLLEMNITSALGGTENAHINRAMLGHPVLREFVSTHGLDFTDTIRMLADSLRGAVGDRLRPGESLVAITDWPDSFVSSEPRLRLLATLLAEHGIKAVACHVGQLTAHRGGGLEVGGRRVDVVFRFFLLEEIVTTADLALVEPVLAAEERGELAIFSRLDAELYGNKGTLAMLSDERNASVFTEQERDCVRRFLPWTRFVRNSVSTPDGNSADVLDYAAARQHELMLKPVLRHGGAGIVAGWSVSEHQWRDAVASAVDQPFVLQERVRPAMEMLPGGDGVFANWGVFLFDPGSTGTDGFGGCMLRGVTDPEIGVVSMRDRARLGCCFHPAVDGDNALLAGSRLSTVTRRAHRLRRRRRAPPARDRTPAGATPRSPHGHPTCPRGNGCLLAERVSPQSPDEKEPSRNTGRARLASARAGHVLSKWKVHD